MPRPDLVRRHGGAHPPLRPFTAEEWWDRFWRSDAVYRTVLEDLKRQAHIAVDWGDRQSFVVPLRPRTWMENRFLEADRRHVEYTPNKVFVVDPDGWTKYVPRESDNYDWPMTGSAYQITDTLIRMIEQAPDAWKPENPLYAKNHVNAPGTVRRWFRQMRAADFERDVRNWAAFSPRWKPDGAGPWDDGHDVLRFRHFKRHPDDWTLFDTQKVVDRETRWAYNPQSWLRGWVGYQFAPPPYPAMRGRITGIEPIDEGWWR